MSCICQNCEKHYEMDLIVPDDVWEKIKSRDKDVGAGLLCPICIVKRIQVYFTYCSWKIIENK